MISKPRGDSKLKTLAPDKQALIVEWLNTGTREAARARIEREFGVETNGASLSDFYHWFYLERDLTESADFADSLKKTLRELPGLHLDEEQIGRAAQVAFELRAMKAGDTDAFVALRKIRQQDQVVKLAREKQDLDEQKYQRETCSLFLKWYADRKAQDIAGSAASNTEKLEKLGQLMFGEEWTA